MDRGYPLPMDVALHQIKHWQSEQAAAQAQIESGKYPEFDDSAREYIRECAYYIKRLKERAGIEG